jgi:hypothetical protein
MFLKFGHLTISITAVIIHQAYLDGMTVISITNPD